VTNQYGRQGFHLAGVMTSGKYHSNLIFERPLVAAPPVGANPPDPASER